MLVALVLAEAALVGEVVMAVPAASVDAVAKSVPPAHVATLLGVVADLVERDPRLERNLAWAVAVLGQHHDALSLDGERHAPQLRALHKAVAAHERRIGALCEGNAFELDFLLAQ